MMVSVFNLLVLGFCFACVSDINSADSNSSLNITTLLLILIVFSVIVVVIIVVFIYHSNGFFIERLIFI